MYLEVFKNDRDNVDKSTSLRLRYLLLILKEANVSCIGKTTAELVNSLFALGVADPTFLCLCTCDLLMSSADWAPTWGKLISEHSDMNTLCDAMLQKFGLDKATLVSKCATTPKNSTEQQRDDDKGIHSHGGGPGGEPDQVDAATGNSSCVHAF